MSPIGDIFRQGYPSLCINKDILSAFGDRAWLYPKANRLAGRMAGVDHNKFRHCTNRRSNDVAVVCGARFSAAGDLGVVRLGGGDAVRPGAVAYGQAGNRLAGAHKPVFRSRLAAGVAAPRGAGLPRPPSLPDRGACFPVRWLVLRFALHAPRLA